MRSIALDFRRTRGPAVELARAVLLVAGVSVLTAAAIAWSERWQALKELESRVEVERRAGKRETGALQVRPGDAPRLEAEVRRANAVIDELATPWLDLLDALEATRGEKVALLAIQPDARQRTVRITAEAKSLEEALAYSRRLTAHPRLAGAHFVNHEILRQTPGEPVRVQILAAWRLAP